MPKGYHADGSLMGAAAENVATGRYMSFLKPPEQYSDDVRFEVLARIAGGQTLADIECDPSMPTRRTVQLWVMADPDFAELYRQVRRIQAETLVDGAVDSARNASDKDSASASRVQADTFLKVAGMLDPSRYAPKPSHAGAVNVTIATNLGGPAQIQQDGAYRVTIDASQHDEPGNPQETTTS